ncbi:MAG: DsrE/DsrF/DrsH-like family protein [Acidilobaceae archaeon]
MGSETLAIIVRSDNPESVYPALIIASTAASMGVKVEVLHILGVKGSS